MNYVKSVLAVVGSFFSYFLGGWDILIQWLITFMVIDYALGIAKGMLGVNGVKLNSKVGFKGLVKKIVILVVVAIAQGLDQLFASPEANIFNIDMPLIRTLVIWGYIINEIISILENVKDLGVPAPKFIKKALDVVLSVIDGASVNKKGDDK